MDIIPAQCKSVSTHLLKCNVELGLFNKKPISVRALIDSGSTHSFISPKILSDSQVEWAKSNCSRKNFNIQGATGMVKCQCCITRASIQLASWSGSHEFIIANPINKHDAILGRDFLQQIFVLNKL